MLPFYFALNNPGRYVSEEATAKLIQQYDDIISSEETVRAETLEKMIRQLSNILDDLEWYSTRTVYEQEQ
ncbi:hypothetical protein [Kurthia massiliensis]|uniref:hypothetical protein n=1 Tax=Kurthia massiliensis TaxID=1033739 RepID=UPI0002881C5D|nr:hypothetical protein [Kurthia massiliensis]